MRLLFLHTLTVMRELARQPMYVVTTLLFPSLFFWFFGIPNARDSDGLALLTASFSAFGVLGVVLFQFGVSVAQERESSWYSYLRVLPARRGVVWGSRLLAGAIFALAAAAGVLLTAWLAGDMEWSRYHWPAFFAALLLGGIPFALLGICLGLVTSRHSAVPVMNLVYLPLSFAGGLWMPPSVLPKAVQEISRYLPSRFYGEIVWASLFGNALPREAWMGLLLSAFLFGSILIFLSRREEARNFT